MIARRQAVALPLVHRYRTSRPWLVGVLASAATAAVLLVTGGLAAAFGPGEAAVGARVRERLASHPASAPAAAATPAPPATGRWKIQVGAFRDAAAARGRLREVAKLVPALAAYPAAPDLIGQRMRARFGGIGGGAEAADLCARVVDTGSDCFPVAPGT